MEKAWLKQFEKNKTFIDLDGWSIPLELYERLDSFADKLEKRGYEVRPDEIIEEALQRFLPPAEEINAFIKDLPKIVPPVMGQSSRTPKRTKASPPQQPDA